MQECSVWKRTNQTFIRKLSQIGIYVKNFLTEIPTLNGDQFPHKKVMVPVYQLEIKCGLGGDVGATFVRALNAANPKAAKRMTVWG